MNPAGRAARVLIVGCGRIAGGFNEADDRKALTHAVAYRRLGANLVACCDRHPDKAAAFARRWSIPYHSADLDDALRRTEPNVVSVCTPPGARRQILERVVAAGTVRAVLLEKPIADGLDDAAAIRRLIREAGLPVIVNYFRAFDPFSQVVTRFCRDAVFGPVCEAVVRYYGRAEDNASHMLERVLDVLGADVRGIRLSGRDDAPTFAVEAAAAPRARALFIPTEKCDYAPLELDLLFSRGRLRIVDSEGRAEAFTAVPDPDFAGFSMLAPARLPGLDRPDREGLLHSVAAVLRGLRDGHLDGALLDRAVAITRLLDEVTASPRA